MHADGPEECPPLAGEGPSGSRLAMLLEYDGSRFCGWQSQKEGESVQGCLEKALTTLCGEAVRVIGAGRTDAGVHALGQVAHFDTRKAMPVEVWGRALNALTPDGVSILGVWPVCKTFHARSSASGRTYLYRLRTLVAPPALDRGRVWHVRGGLDTESMARAGELLLGRHDFSAFRAASCQARSPVREMRRVEVRSEPGEIHLWFEANAFLQHMVRNLVGSLVVVGQGRWSPDRFGEVFAGRDRTRAAATAPAHGLYLYRVAYGEGGVLSYSG
ncbi:MAG: tRNA pseudouridine(38-40) synthase TruA [Magnetococcales bacterium]|nr:tRNA pseudouridine(38-40) synthase TruA [Magnetococcales bacterium]